MNTQDLMVSLIRAEVIDVAGADAIKAEWAAKYRFILKIASFGDVV